MPKINLTDVAIKRLKRPESSPVDHWDTTVRGLGLRISPSGRRTFNVQINVLRSGRRRDARIKIGVYPEVSLAEARATATKYKRLAGEGLDPVVVLGAEREAMERKSERLSVTTFAAVRDRFFEAHLPTLRPSSVAEYRRVLTNTFAKWDAVPLESIDTDMVLDVLDEIDGPYMANRTHAYLSKMFNWSVAKRIIPISPISDIAKPNKEESRVTVLSESEIMVLWQAAGVADYPFGPMFKVLLLTGQRLREVAGMRQQDLDFEKAVWTLPGSLTKNKEQHSVPLSTQVISILECLPRTGDEFVFTTTGRRPVSGFSKAKKILDAGAGVTGWRWHDLRRTFATYAAEQLDIDLPVAEAVLNHKSGSSAGVVGVYNRARYTRQKAAALQAWANLVDRITGEVDADNVVEMMNK